MKGWFRERWPLVVLVVAGLATRLTVIGHPARAVFDEFPYVPKAQAYLQGKYSFDSHPPLGRLLLAASLKLAGADPETPASRCGREYPRGFPYAAARLLPALAGALLPALLYGLARSLGLSRASSFMAGGLATVDTALLAESHFALIDLFVPAFGLSAAILFLRHRQAASFSRSWWGLLAGAGAFAGAALSVKWSGLSALGVILLVSAVDGVRARELRPFLARIGMAAGLSLAIYAAVFAIHFHLLPRSGRGDFRMSERFRASLQDSPESRRMGLVPMGFLDKVVELHQKIWTANAPRKKSHPQSSRFYEWPFGVRRIMFLGDLWPRLDCIFLIANPVVWGFSTVSLLLGLLYPLLRRERWRSWLASDPDAPRKRAALEFLLLLYAANYLPFALIARSMFLYHYFSAMMVSLVLGALLLFEIIPAVEGRAPRPEQAAPGFPGQLLLAAATSMFIFLSPVTYGFTPRFEGLLRAYLGL